MKIDISTLYLERCGYDKTFILREDPCLVLGHMVENGYI